MTQISFFFATVNGIVFDQLATIPHHHRRYGFPSDPVRQPQVYMGRGNAFDVEPDVFLPPVLEQVFVLVLVPAHVHTKPSCLGFGWESEVEDHFVKCGEGLGGREG